MERADAERHLAEVAAARARWPFLDGKLLRRPDLPLTAPWEPTVAELNLLARPFLEMAGLDHLDVFVEMFDGDEKLRGLGAGDKARPGHRPAIWFDQIAEGLCVLGAEESAVVEVDRCVADMALIGAQVFRVARGLDAPDVDEELWASQVMAVLLGFGPQLALGPVSLSPHDVLSLIIAGVAAGQARPDVVEAELPAALRPAFIDGLMT